jgi:hypothetical protein
VLFGSKALTKLIAGPLLTSTSDNSSLHPISLWPRPSRPAHSGCSVTTTPHPPTPGAPRPDRPPLPSSAPQFASRCAESAIFFIFSHPGSSSKVVTLALPQVDSKIVNHRMWLINNRLVLCSDRTELSVFYLRRQLEAHQKPCIFFRQMFCNSTVGIILKKKVG